MRRYSAMSRPVSVASVWISPRMSLIVSLLALDELGPGLAVGLDRLAPLDVELVPVVGLEERLALDAIALGETQQPALEPHQALVDVVELLDEALDTRGVERQRLHVGDHRRAEALELLDLGVGRGLGVGDARLGVLVLQLAHLAVGFGDAVEGLDHLRLELGFHRRQRQRVLEIVVVVLDRVLRRPAAPRGRSRRPRRPTWPRAFGASAAFAGSGAGAALRSTRSGGTTGAACLASGPA